MGDKYDERDGDGFHPYSEKRRKTAALVKVLKKLAESVSLKDASVYSVSGGPAVAGEVNLSAESVYISVNLGVPLEGAKKVLMRYCRFKNDYSGANVWRDTVPSARELGAFIERESERHGKK